ncbi:hypothetical protein CJF31_00007763 [Rutstroemia sp. NJR-2017a BVV2]|nr:hypothetical protein CJF31_00005337 [Rutstroemia sp. NJR-2017a BVV2]PQE21936.1 hypothetical protein CJF31_00007763 [Rutstroemia sp. NJR-2017a BVV2]
MNELYPYFRFLKDVATTNTFAEFKKAYCNDQSVCHLFQPRSRNFADMKCNSRLDAVLSRLVIRGINTLTSRRRTMQSRIMDKEIVTLPNPHRKDVTIEFDPVTEVLYRAVERKFRELIKTKNSSDSKADPRKKLKYIIIMILRLRQFTASPVLIEPQMKIMFDAFALREVQKKMQEVHPDSELQGADLALHDRITMWIDDLEHGREIPNSYKLSDEDECWLCYDATQDPQQIRECGHLFCGACIEDNIIDQTSKSDTLHCPKCGKIFLFERLKSIGKSPHAIAKAAKKGRDTLNFAPRLDVRSEWLEEFDKGNASLPRSAKVDAIRNKLRTWKKEAPSDKVIIFVQWSLMIRLIGVMLQEEDIPFIYYVVSLQKKPTKTGEMSQNERTDALKAFETTPEVTVLLIGLKVGGVGLNLTCANRAIMVDLWWNSAVENQANSRIYRIGQDKETHFARFMMRRSVDIRLLQIVQIRKSKEIDGTLNGKGSLSAKDTLGFLGEVVNGSVPVPGFTDGFGAMVEIISDYEKLDDWLNEHLNKLPPV